MITSFKFLADLLNSNLGVVTFLVGFFAIYLYVKQKNDRKRDAASLILQEVRYAEQQIRNFKYFNNYKLSEHLLPTNSWNDNVHLFLKDLEEGQIDLVSRFYSRAEFIDDLVRKISDQKSITSPMVAMHGPINQPIDPMSTDSNQLPPPPEFIMPPPIFGLLKTVSNSVEFIYNTPTGEKLKKIAKRRWYHF
jgi:hypothetical protein